MARSSPARVAIARRRRWQPRQTTRRVTDPARPAGQASNRASSPVSRRRRRTASSKAAQQPGKTGRRREPRCAAPDHRQPWRRSLDLNPRDGTDASRRGGIDIGNGFNVGDNYNNGGLGGWEGGRVNVGPLTGEDFARGTSASATSRIWSRPPSCATRSPPPASAPRTLRRDFRGEQKKPDWTVAAEIIAARRGAQCVAEGELARRDLEETLTPIDRDPVPNRFAESVRRYYESWAKTNDVPAHGTAAGRPPFALHMTPSPPSPPRIGSCPCSFGAVAALVLL